MLCPPRSRYPLNKGPVRVIPPVDAAGPNKFPRTSSTLTHMLPRGNKPSAGALTIEPLRGEASDQPKGLTMFKRTIAIAFVSVSLLAIAACNTVEGAGKDVSSAGKAVANAADDAK